MKRIPTFFLLVFITGTARAAPPEDFVTFLHRFRSDRAFRVARVEFPLKARVGSSCEEDVKTFAWNRHAFTLKFTLPRTLNDLAAEGLSEQITQPSSVEVQVLQFRDEADSYLLKYTFRLRRGRWFLEGFEDTSC
jgi:hypothetical protein